MLKLLNFLFAVRAANNACRTKVKVQIVQVQDATDSMNDAIDEMKSKMESVLQAIAKQYGSVEFGLASFTDKPQIVTGTGPNTGVWRTGAEKYVRDYCYARSKSIDGTVNYDNLLMGGGKDPIENQFDALAMASMDPKMNWTADETSDEVVIRLAILVTDAAAHRNSEIDRSLEKRNWYNEELMSGPCPYNIEKPCDKDFGVRSGRTGMALSLQGVLDHYDHFKLGGDIEYLTNAEFTSWKHYTPKEFRGFRSCCTDAYNYWPRMYGLECNDMENVMFKSYEDCARISCKSCSKDENGIDECSKTKRCREGADPNFEVEWMKDIYAGPVKVTPYVYGLNRFQADCSTMEYPDPFSEEYAKIFKINDVIPVFFVRIPEGAPWASPKSEAYPFTLRAMSTANHVCPVVGQELAKYWLCTYEKAQKPDGIVQATDACNNYDRYRFESKASNWYRDCYEEHYGEVVKSLVSHGVSSHYVPVEYGTTPQELMSQLMLYIVAIIENDPKCTGTTMGPVTPPRTASINTTANGETEEGGGTTGVIVGSAAGGVAAIGAAAALWAKFFPTSYSTPLQTHIEEAELQNDTIEREQMTNIQGSMFM